jgi:hypothetical protein
MPSIGPDVIRPLNSITTARAGMVRPSI